MSARRKRPAAPRFHKTLRRQVTERDARRIFRDGTLLAYEYRAFGSTDRVFVRIRYRGASYAAWMPVELAAFELRDNKSRRTAADALLIELAK
jgi:hypothetical protein